MGHNFTLHREALCPNIEDHMPCPDGYIQWHAWAVEMNKTHKQRQCQGCGLWAIWEPRDQSATLSQHKRGGA